jgi:ribosomal protein S18 acetylase RimI-like enzyme
MSAFSLKPAFEFPISQLADILTRGFEGYFVPIHITDTVLLTMMRRDSIDLTASRVLFRDEEPVGLALIARRGWASRLAAMGIISSARNSGAGTWAMKHIIEEARARGDREMFLEVIAQNTAGIKLYEKVGFKILRGLFGYKVENPQSDAKETLQEIDIRDIAKQVTIHGLNDLPWQLSGATISHHTPPSRAFCLNNAYCLISDPNAEHISISSVLVETRSRGTGQASALLRALFAQFPNKTWHVPALFPEEICFVFEKAGMQREEISQYQMVLGL